MTPERWQKVGELYQDALKRAPEERDQFLHQTCNGDEDLRREVEALLAAEDSAGSFMSGDAMEDAARLLAQEQTGALAGQIIGHYRVLELLGQGGMGEVYLAEDIRLKRKVALKLLPPYFMISRDRVKRFEQEARAISALNHPNIVTIHEIGRLNDVNFIVTEFIDGQTLREIMSERRMDVLEVLDLTVQIANALSAAHAAGIIHRDIKPENIMVRRDGYVKVLDFGLAKLMERQAGAVAAEAPTKIFAQTQPGLVMGSTSYMSPEQARGTDVDGQTDIWSLGVVLYEMVTGCIPFEGETPTDVIAAILERRPPALVTLAPSTSPKLQAIVTRTLKKHRDERYQTIGQLLSDLRELKQALDARAHLERRAGSTESVATGEAIQKTTTQLAAHTKSSAEYIVGELKHHKAAAAAAALIFVIAIGLIAGYSYFSPRNRSAAGAEAIDSIAVLPFVNVDNDPNKEYLAEGISDSLITNLTQLRSLRVMSLSSVLRYKGKQTDAQTVGRELKVGAVLMGRLTQRGDELSISTELIDARDNRRLWGQQYNRNVSNILLVENEIGQEVAQKLRPALTGQEQKQLAKRNTENTEAYHLYSLGNYYLRNIRGPERVHKALEYFNRAIEADPKYALAYCGLFKIYFGLGGEGQMPPKELRPKIEWAALKAVELDYSLSAAHAALGFAKKMNWDWAGAEKEYQRAIELDPNNFEGYFGYYILLINVGRADEAIPLAKRAMELDEIRRNHLALVNLYKREFDATIDLLIKDKGNPKSRIQILGEAYLGKGMNDEAVAQFENLVNPDEPTTWRGYPLLAYAYAAAGQRDKALKILDEQKKLAKQRYVSPFNFAIIYTGLGDKDRAFQFLEKCIEERVIVLYHFPQRAIFDPLRTDPRYEKLLRKMNLPV